MNSRVKFSKCKSENLVKVVILVFHGQFFLHLVKNFTALSSPHICDALHGLTDEINECIVEASPLDLNVVSNKTNIELELCAICKVGELAQPF